VFLARRTSEPPSGSVIESWELDSAGNLEPQGQVTVVAPIDALRVEDSSLLARASRDLFLIDAADPAALQVIGYGQPDGCLWPDLNTAEWDAEGTLWMPLGDYGAMRITLQP
jgi:hypothetical protein